MNPKPLGWGWGEPLATTGKTTDSTAAKYCRLLKHSSGRKRPSTEAKYHTHLVLNTVFKWFERLASKSTQQYFKQYIKVHATHRSVLYRIWTGIYHTPFCVRPTLYPPGFKIDCRIHWLTIQCWRSLYVYLIYVVYAAFKRLLILSVCLSVFLPPGLF